MDKIQYLVHTCLRICTKSLAIVTYYLCIHCIKIMLLHYCDNMRKIMSSQSTMEQCYRGNFWI